MSSALIEKAKTNRINTSTIADVLDSLGIESLIPPVVHAINALAPYFIGVAYTVAWERVRKGANIMNPQPSTWEQVKSFLVPDIRDGTGLVYVAGAGPLLTDAALAGGMSCTYFDRLGFEGVVLGGAVRDIPEVRKLTMPVLATNPVPVDTQGTYRIKAIGTECSVGNCLIRTGDLIISDASGTVVVPAPYIDTALAKSIDIDALERSMLDQVRDGARLPDLVESQKRI
ncbi:RraA family protein [Burkholderia pyrrocinia]